MSRLPKAPSACLLAEFREWWKLHAQVEKDASHAYDRDTRGNLPLHWAGRDPDVPVAVLHLLVDAFPDGRRETNYDGQLPFQIAIEHGLPPSHIQLLNADHANDVDPAWSVVERSDPSEHVTEGGATADNGDHLQSLVTQLNALRRSLHAQAKIYSHLRKHNWAASTSPGPSPSSVSCQPDPLGRYTLTWKRGDVGIRFFNSSVGCRVEKLSQGHGITAGIMNCRLGDVLVAINGKNMEKHSVRAVMEFLLGSPKPVVLEFVAGDNITSENSQSDNDDDSIAWCHSQHEMHDQVLLLVQDTIARCESAVLHSDHPVCP
ncbi:hypothetical protein DYB36_009584 [Aphanomyces astaci]|uniref:Uncharacterized protein n=1 Tax=Aphanomyces astaci TaxID=112090 RepID=A0A397B936_APHAT|nr:hypothetical protein DYB36_009584 [Aphanomyces astaci]